jgi:signal transduction histidine kinase
MPRLVSFLRRGGGDILVLALAAGMQAEFWAATPSAHPALFLLVALGSLPLLARRRYPVAAPLCVPVAAVVISFLDAEALEESVVWVITLIVAMWLLGIGNERPRAILGGLLTYAAAQVLSRNFSGEIVSSDVIFTALLVWAPLLAGQAVRVRDERTAELRRGAERLVADREEQARAAVAAERARIARELHDVVAHSISVMTIQAGAARLVLDDEPARAEGPLRTVEETGRQTLAEMRRLLGVLDAGGNGAAVLAPQPGLGELQRLVESMRAAGLSVDLDVQGEASPLAPGVDLTAYRVVQEALTNVLKHAGAARARVVVRYGPDAVELEVADDGRGRASGLPGGHGLLGMRERVSLYGGDFEAAPRAQGGFLVRARLPLGEPA